MPSEASSNAKVIVSCAVTGSIHVPSLTPYLPITPAEIAASAIGASEAGAAIVHLHARDPETGRPSPDPDLFAQFLPAIREQSKAVINITTGGGHGMSVEERTEAARRFAPELCSLNMGSMNFGLFPMLDRVGEFKHEWERAYLEQSRNFIFRNTFTDIEWIIGELGAKGTRFEFECYDVGHLYNLAHVTDRGLVAPPFFVQTIFGILGGVGPDPDNLRVPITRFGMSERVLAGSPSVHLMRLLVVSARPRSGCVALQVGRRERGRDTRVASRARGASPAGGPPEVLSS